MSSIIPKPVIYIIITIALLIVTTIGTVIYLVVKNRAERAYYVAPFYNKLKKLEQPFKKDADKKEYERVMIDYVSMADMAKAIFPIDTTLAGKEKALSDIKGIGIYYWERNIEILTELRNIDLPNPLKHRTQLFIEYCQLNKEYCELVYKAVDEHTDAYDEKLEAYFKRIENKMKEIRAT